jgi:PEP-CTERM motif
MGAFGGPLACRWVGIEPDPEFFEAYQAQLDTLGRTLPGQPDPVYAVTLDGTPTGDVIVTATGPLVTATGIEVEDANTIWVIQTRESEPASTEVPIAVGDIPGLIDLDDPMSARAGPFATFFAVPRDLTDPSVAGLHARVRVQPAAAPMLASRVATPGDSGVCARFVVIDEQKRESWSRTCHELGDEFLLMVVNLLTDPLDPVVPGLLADLTRITGLRIAFFPTALAPETAHAIAVDAVFVPEPDTTLLSGTALLALLALRRLYCRRGIRSATAR